MKHFALVPFALLLVTLSNHASSEDMPESKSISGRSSTIERIVDEELGVVCYYAASGNGKTISCLQLRK